MFSPFNYLFILFSFISLNFTFTYPPFSDIRLLHPHIHVYKYIRFISAHEAEQNISEENNSPNSNSVVPKVDRSTFDLSALWPLGNRLAGHTHTESVNNTLVLFSTDHRHPVNNDVSVFSSCHCHQERVSSHECRVTLACW